MDKLSLFEQGLSDLMIKCLRNKLMVEISQQSFYVFCRSDESIHMVSHGYFASDVFVPQEELNKMSAEVDAHMGTKS